jgi:hypothetical protein
MSWYERLHEGLSASFVLNVMGASRPALLGESVEEAGFVGVEREFVGGVIPSEIIVGVKG